MPASEVKRFSDQELMDFHKQFQHHVEIQAERDKLEDERHQNLINAQSETARQLEGVIKNTSEIIDAWKDVKSTIRVGEVVQKALLWIAKWGFIGGTLTVVWEYIVKRIH